MSIEEYIKEWEDKAETDLQVINRLSENSLIAHSAICFHCQQLDEKYLKLFLIHNEKTPTRTHNIEFLLVECAEFDEDFNTIDPKNLSDFEVNIRYPGSYYIPSDNETREYISISIQIRDIVRSKVGLEKKQFK
jgi:HEPN domain-containing protein